MWTQHRGIINHNVDLILEILSEENRKQLTIIKTTSGLPVEVRLRAQALPRLRRGQEGGRQGVSRGE